jgi:hypothetical protein
MQKKTGLITYILFLCPLFIILYSGICNPEVGGDCDACHVCYPGMKEKRTSVVQPFQYVNREIFCINCHSSSTSDTIKNLGGNNVPVVFNNVKPVRSLAGGNFYFVAKDFGDRKGHNVNVITSSDKEFPDLPPGYSRASDPSSIGYNPKKPLACAGSNGCHGDRNIEDPFVAIFGTHHAVDRPIDGSTTARSYRYLKITGKVDGVSGLEDNEWNKNAVSMKHNEYSLSIDLLCKSCHGELQRGHAGTRFKHLSGIPIPDRGEYRGYTIYSLDAPVARVIVPQVYSDLVTPGKDLVTCLSCHVAHAGPYDSALRWDYDNIFTGEEEKSGCKICHTGK